MTTMTEWDVDFSGIDDPKYGRHQVPMVTANEETLKGYGRIVRDFEAEKVDIVPWPVSGTRELCEGTGLSSVVEGDYYFSWEGDLCSAHNTATGLGSTGPFITGRLPSGTNPKNRTKVLVRESNNHPDGGQVFFPKDGAPFVAVLAFPGDDIKLEDFKAFYFDGTFGLHILPNVWHQPMYPLSDTATFKNKQGALFACVSFDSIKEFGVFLEVPLTPDGK